MNAASLSAPRASAGRPDLYPPRPSTGCLSGALVDLVDPDWRTIAPGDVGLGLARINRWLGQTVRPFSVAEHSLVVMRRVQMRHGTQGPPLARLRLAALLHDGHEAFVGDLINPVQRALETASTGFSEAFAGMKYRLDVAIARATLAAFAGDGLKTFGAQAEAEWLAVAMRSAPVKAADRAALEAEHLALVGHGGGLWTDEIPPDAPANVAWDFVAALKTQVEAAFGARADA